MSTGYIPVYYFCGMCGKEHETCIFPRKYNYYGKKVYMTSCCLAPIGICCSDSEIKAMQHGIICLFCPNVRSHVIRIRKTSISNKLKGSNISHVFDNWEEYCRELQYYHRWFRDIAQKADFLKWVAKKRPDVTIRWLNFRKSFLNGNLYETFKNEPIFRNFLSQLFHNQLSLQKSMPLNPQLNDRFLALQVEYFNFFQSISKIFPSAKFIAQSRIQFMKNIAKRFAVERINEENTRHFRMLLWILKRILTKKIIAIQCVPV